MSDPKPRPTLNFSAILFPSDQVTVGQLRKEQPELFADVEDFREHRIRALEIAATIKTEHVLAEKAFAAAMGLADPHPDYNRREAIRLLNDDYSRYGISTGLQKTTQLVRELEKAAKSQAKQHGGRAG